METMDRTYERNWSMMVIELLAKAAAKVFYLPKKMAAYVMASATPYITFFRMAFWPNGYPSLPYPQNKNAVLSPKKHLNYCRQPHNSV